MNVWIDVNDRLPETAAVVLVCVAEHDLNGRIIAKSLEVGSYYSQYNAWTFGDRDPTIYRPITVTHWMPAPLPPQ